MEVRSCGSVRLRLSLCPRSLAAFFFNVHFQIQWVENVSLCPLFGPGVYVHRPSGLHIQSVHLKRLPINQGISVLPGHSRVE
jgi:hypothetical protein